jgi:His/Glu/Gln/Arg/opine family amino acid ABC transporter permease subunit
LDLSLLITYGPDLMAATWLTVVLTVTTVVLSTVLGIPLAVLAISGGRVVKAVLYAYSFAMRAIPLLLILYIIYYGLPSMGIVFDALPTAIIGLVVAATAYNMEIIRAGLEAVDKGQWESSAALGIPPLRTWKDVVIPQALPFIIPPFISNAIIVLKGTSVASIITIGELTAVTNGLISMTYQAFGFLAFSALIYLALSSVLTLLQQLAERHWKVS